MKLNKVYPFHKVVSYSRNKNQNNQFFSVAVGARERLVQISGPDESKINHAKNLIEETIRRNQSPDFNEGFNPGKNIVNE